MTAHNPAIATSWAVIDRPYKNAKSNRDSFGILHGIDDGW